MSRRDYYSLGFILVLFGGLAGCGSTHSTASGPVPASISLTPSISSLEMGQIQQLTATAQNNNKQSLTVTFSYNSSNTAVLTISNAGLVCAGSWDSVVAPIRCTPGPAGVVTVTASTGGVVSPPITIYVHSHIDNISIAPLPPEPTNNCNPPGTNSIGISQNQTINYEATAFSQGKDITATVGPFTWSLTNTTIVKLNTNVTGLLTNQVQATADAPGMTQIFTSAGGVSSGSVVFLTCPVESIVLGVAGGSGNSINFAKTGNQSVTATVTDSALPTGTILTNLTGLTWSSSDPLVASAAANGNLGGIVTGHSPGGATIIASCTPPSCNTGIVPSLSIYPNTAISVTVAPGGTPATTNAFVTTTDCADKFGCTSSIVAIAVPANTVGASATLPNTPNSFVFDRQGKTGYLGSDHGLMVFTASGIGGSTNPVAVHGNVPGKVLAVSHNGNKVIVSDTSSIPNQVFIFDTTTSGGVVNLLISGATAAAFSPDDVKAYIVAGNTLYGFSTLEPLQTISLPAPAADVTFLPEGAFAELAGGANSGVAVTPVVTCTTASPVGPFTTTQGTPASIRALVDGIHLLALDPPGIDVITAGTITFPSSFPPCPPSIAPGPAPDFKGLGPAQFTPLRFLVASDGSKAYVLASNFAAVMVFDVVTQNPSAIGLTGNATILDGDLTLDGALLYVGGSDGAVHAINTATGLDTQTITFPANFNFCNNVTFTCKPNLLAVQP